MEVLANHFCPFPPRSAPLLWSLGVYHRGWTYIYAADRGSISKLKVVCREFLSMWAGEEPIKAPAKGQLKTT